MRAVVVRAQGGPSVLAVEEVPDPQPGTGQVLVAVSRSGLNFIDVYYRQGLYAQSLPYIAGVEGVGVVRAVGEEVRNIEVGQRVGWFGGSQGSFAEYAVVAADRAIPLPEDVSDDNAVALMMQGITAHYLVRDTFPVSQGDVSLVHAAAGGVGLMLTQMITHLGGTVIATASSESKREAALAAGAAHAIPYEDFAPTVRRLTEGAGVNVVYDGVGAATVDGSLAALGVRGTLVLFGNASGPVPPLDVLRLSQGGSLYVTRPTIAHYTRTALELRERADELFSWLKAGALQVPAITHFSLDEVVAAFEAMESRRTSGKLALIH